MLARWLVMLPCSAGCVSMDAILCCAWRFERCQCEASGGWNGLSSVSRHYFGMSQHSISTFLSLRQLWILYLCLFHLDLVKCNITGSFRYSAASN